MATQIHSKPGLVKLFGSCPQEVRDHFKHLPGLLDSYPMEVALAYSFQRLELGQNMVLYCGVVKVHRADSRCARGAISSIHMTRKLFSELYRTVFDTHLPAQAKKGLDDAERTRDRIMHGRPASDDLLRNAIGRVLEFAKAVNGQLNTKCKLTPFCGDWRGFAGRLKKLEPRVTKFMLKGMGFPLS